MTPAYGAPADEFIRHDEREKILRDEQAKTPDIHLPRNILSSEDTPFLDNEKPCFPISEISLVGDQGNQFQFALKSVHKGKSAAVGHCLGTQGINSVLVRVQNAIIEQGFVTTRVLVAPQDLKSGTLQLTVVPGRVDAIAFSSNTNPRRTLQTGLPLAKGDVINLRAIEQGLENFKRLPTVDADIKIAPSSKALAKPGDSDLIVQYQQAFPLRLQITADDGGSKATSKYQGGITLSYDNPLALSDLFYINVNHDLNGGNKGTSGHTLHYSVPFGYWLIALSTDKYDYHQSIAGSDSAYIYSGQSRNIEMKLSRLLYRDAKRKTTASMRSYLKHSNNFVNDTVVEIQRRRMAGWEAALVHREFMGSSTFDMGLSYRHGTGAFGSISAPEAEFGEGTARPIVITAHAGLQWPFQLYNQRFEYAGLWRSQWNRTPLIPQDKFAIGGRYTVRGLDGENMLAGERGWLLRNDIGVLLGQTQQQAYIGVDYGAVAGKTADQLLGKALAGAILGLRGNRDRFSYDLFVGRPISKPTAFDTARVTAGFNVGWAY